VLSASTAEEHTAGLNEAMAALTVADVMSGDPIRLPAYRTLDALIDQLTATRQNTFPVFDLQGRVVGIVDIDTLVRLPASERHSRRVGDVVIPAEKLPIATPEESVRDVQQQLAQAPAVLVFDGAGLVGTVTADDITWAARRATLRSHATLGR
jgi:predicted transcriptional regulator